MWVIKLGGSLLGSPELSKWLETLVRISDGKLLIVPGGSLFADAVRQAQQISDIDDATAHHLALLAMDQFGLLLAGMHPNLVTAASELEIAERGWQHRCIVWLPSHMVLADETISKNWQVTSDSLSAWIAKKIGASQLLLVKSASLDGFDSPADVAMLQQQGIVDDAFAQFLHDADVDVWMVHKSNHSLFEQGLNLKKLEAGALKLCAGG